MDGKICVDEFIHMIPKGGPIAPCGQPFFLFARIFQISRYHGCPNECMYMASQVRNSLQKLSTKPQMLTHKKGFFLVFQDFTSPKFNSKFAPEKWMGQEDYRLSFPIGAHPGSFSRREPLNFHLCQGAEIVTFGPQVASPWDDSDIGGVSLVLIGHPNPEKNQEN